METLLLFGIVVVCWLLLFPSCLLLVGRTLNTKRDVVQAQTRVLSRRDNDNNSDITITTMMTTTITIIYNRLQ